MKIESLSTRKFNLLRAPIEVVIFNQRFKRAFQFFGIYFAIALGCVPIPGLHFILVPTFLIFAVYSFYKKLNETKSIQLDSEHCPQCSEKIQDQKIFFNDNVTIRIRCNSCQSQLRLID